MHFCIANLKSIPSIFKKDTKVKLINLKSQKNEH